MRTEHLAKGLLVAGILGLAVGCGNEAAMNGGEGSGGSTSPGSGSGGEATGGTTDGSGGTVSSGGVGSGGTTEAGGAPGTGGAVGTGGRDTGVRGSGGRVRGTGGSSTDETGTGGADVGGATGATGGVAMGGRTGPNGRGGGTGTAGAPGSGGRTTPNTGSGTCTASKDAGSVTGSGPHKVVMEMNSDPGIKCGTIYRPADLGGDEKYPIFVWGEGGCSQSGTSNKAAMGEIASWGYFIVADGVASGTACSGGQSGKAFLDYITWAIAENDKSCSAYYQKLDTTKIAADGFSCGGLMAENVSGDPRFTAIGITSSGLQSPNASLYDKIHTPFKIMNGGSSDMAYQNGLRDYDEISKRGIPIVYFAKSSAGHGGDLNNGKGDFNTVNLAWLNWQLKGDVGATGKGLLIGSSCKFCSASGWEFKSANIQ